MSLFYYPGKPVPHISGTKNIDEIFPEGRKVEDWSDMCKPEVCKEGCTDHGDGNYVCGDKSLWYIFAPLFCKVTELLQWGSIGVVTTREESGDSPFFKYSWRMVNGKACPESKAALDEFFKKVLGDSVTDYLLLGKQAERCFKVKSESPREDASELECLAIVPKNCKVTKPWLITIGWDAVLKDPSENSFAELKNDKEKKAWSNYINEIGTVVGAIKNDHSVIYIPAVCAGMPVHSFDGDGVSVLLAGGLIWCVDDLDKALTVVPEAQLYLRWCLGEILKTCSNIGLSSDPVDRLRVRLNECMERKWFDSRVMPHEWKEAWNVETKANIISLIKMQFGLDGGLDEISSGKIFNAAKGIFLFDGYRPTSVGFIVAVLKGLGGQINEDVNGVGLWDINLDLKEFINADESKLDFFVVLLGFLLQLPVKGEQSWAVSVETCSNIQSLKFCCEGGRRMEKDGEVENLSFSALDDSEHTHHISALWKVLKKQAKIHIENRDGQCPSPPVIIASGACLEFKCTAIKTTLGAQKGR